MTMATCWGLLVFFTCDLTPPPPPVVVCPPLQAWSRGYQARLAGEAETLPAGSALRQAMREHIQLRDRIRKCRK